MVSKIKKTVKVSLTEERFAPSGVGAGWENWVGNCDVPTPAGKRMPPSFGKPADG
jgi:hypothetical protein